LEKDRSRQVLSVIPTVSGKDTSMDEHDKVSQSSPSNHDDRLFDSALKQNYG